MSLWRDTLRRRRQQSYSYNYNLGLSTKSQKMRDLAKIARAAFVGVIALFVLSLIVLPLFAFNLPSPDKVLRREGFSTKILDRNGKILYDIFEDERRTPVKLADMPLTLRQATIAIEDKNFYKHEGFDPLGIMRGLLRCFVGRCQGGSTLTQQLVKNVLLTSERSVLRKIKEFLLAIQIERKFSKDEILQMYLNEAPYGSTSWGVESATEQYFGKNVKDLNLIESAFLAGLPQRPSVYSPHSATPQAYVGRTHEVLRRMREDGYITLAQEEQAKKDLDGIQFLAKGAAFKAPHFVQYVQTVLEDRYGDNIVEIGGLKVTTTLDLELQEKAQEIVSDEIAKVERLKIGNGAAVVMDPETGEILAMVGSKNFNDPNYDGQVNVTMSLRQPGSAIKPITYATGLKKGFTASTLFMDVPTTFPGGAGQPDYKPVNYDGKYRGPIQMRYALGNSINIPAVKMLALAGIKDTLSTAYDLGLTTLEPNQETLNRVGLSLTLGGGEVRLLELTGAYSGFANGGYRVEPVAILKVEDADGKVLEENSPKKGRRVLSSEHAYIIADILSDNSARTLVFGPNSLLNVPGRQIMAKTGTTNDRRDNWALGGDKQRMVGVWVGNNDNSPMGSVASGVSGASPIWRRILVEALRNKPNVKFERPGGIVTASVDAVSGYRSHDGYPSRSDIFAKGTEPRDDTVHVKLKVCKNDGKLAAPSDIASNNYDEKEFFVFKEEDPTAGKNGPNRWQEGIMAWLAGQSDPRYHPPVDYCGSTNPVHVTFNYPGDREQLTTNSFEIRIAADSIDDIDRVELYINGENKRNFSGPPYNENVTLADGVYTLRAKARDKSGREAERTITVGVNVSPDPSPSPTPSSSP